MDILKKYFRYDAKALLLECEISKHRKAINKLRRQQRALNKKQRPLEDTVRSMFDSGVFTNYWEMTKKALQELKQ